MLHTVMYHYVQDPARMPFPLKVMPVDAFRRQVHRLAECFEMATMESAMAYLAGGYRPRRDLCLLTFDDGLAEHGHTVTPLLVEKGIEGIFFLITACCEEHRVAAVHMNHVLMAALPFGDYRREFFHELAIGPDEAQADAAAAEVTYPWDSPEVASFKYYFNFLARPSDRDRAVSALFQRYFGREDEFSRTFYLSWTGARAMQSAGMKIGGHTHLHRPLSSLAAPELFADLDQCRRLLHSRLRPQPYWPFSYPYGKLASFTPESVSMLRKLGFHCGCTTEEGANQPGTDPFLLRRVDCKKTPLEASASLTEVAQ